jgi:sugar lactone lactonase YvrE
MNVMFIVLQMIEKHLTLYPVTYSLELGEGPHWDAKRQKLYFVDMTAHEIHSYCPKTRKHYKAKVGKLDEKSSNSSKNTSYIFSMCRRW